MKILYLVNIRIPTNRAHGIQIMKTCEALSKQGNEVELVIPTRKNLIKEDPFLYYKIEKNFVIKKILSPDLVGFGRIGVYIQYTFFSLSSLFYSLSSGADIFYSRDELPIWFLSFFDKMVFWEVHNGKWNFLVSSLTKRCQGLVTISGGIKNFFVDKGVLREKIIVAPDAADIDDFYLNIKKEEARKAVNLPQNKKIIMYTGHLYEWKGADTIGQVAKNFNDEYLFVFVGGTIKHVEDFKKRHLSGGQILMVGQKTHGEIPLYLKSADVLVIPNSAKEDISRLYTSPMKLFEYMASGTPIIASELPSIREILDDNGAVFFKPDDPESLTKAIIKVFDNPTLADKMANISRENSHNYSWDKRAEKIHYFLLKNGIKK